MRWRILCFLLLPLSLFAAAAPPSPSKISVHLLNAYSSGASQIIQAHPPVIKILGTDGGMLQAARDFKASTPEGKVVCRIYTSRRWTAADDPAAAGTNFWQTVLAPALNLSSADKALIDYVEGPNEGDSTPTWTSVTDAQWFNTFWMHLAPLIANAGFRPLAFSISVGNPPGTPAQVQASLDAIVPALRLCQSLGGGWSYHSYSLPYSTNLADEIWYSVRYRQYYSYFASRYSDLTNLPIVLTEGGIDGVGPWSTRGDTNQFQGWLAWFDSEIRRDPYCLGVTLFQIGNTNDWAGFNVEPVAGWIAGYLNANSVNTNPPPLVLAFINDATNVTVTLKGAVNPLSVTNTVANYFLRRADTSARVSVLSASAVGGTNLLLRTAPLEPYTDYLITVSHVGPVGYSGPVPGSNGTTNLVSALKLVALDDRTAWRYDDSGTNLGSSWKEKDFDDSAWPQGPALLGFESAALPEPLRTMLNLQNGKVTYYFRRPFHWAYASSNGLLRVRQVIDDGIVLYLNGREIHRIGLTNNPVIYTNLASRSVADAVYEGPYFLSVSNLAYGQNMLSAEVHQQAVTSGDIVFGLSVDALARPSAIAAARPILNLRAAVVPGFYYVSWTNSAFILQSAPAPEGPWTQAAPQGNPYTVDATGEARYFRLTQ